MKDKVEPDEEGEERKVAGWEERALVAEITLCSYLEVSEKNAFSPEPRFVKFRTKVCPINRLTDPNATKYPTEKLEADMVTIWWQEIPLSCLTDIKGYIKDPKIFCPDSGGLTLKLRFSREKYRRPFISGLCFAVMKAKI